VGEEHCASFFGVKKNCRNYSSATLALLPAVRSGRLSLPFLSKRYDVLVETPKTFPSALIGIIWFISDMTSHG
jgi:hypothetical protein